MCTGHFLSVWERYARLSRSPVGTQLGEDVSRARAYLSELKFIHPVPNPLELNSNSEDLTTGQSASQGQLMVEISLGGRLSHTALPTPKRSVNVVHWAISNPLELCSTAAVSKLAINIMFVSARRIKHFRISIINYMLALPVRFPAAV